MRFVYIVLQIQLRASLYLFGSCSPVEDPELSHDRDLEFIFYLPYEGGGSLTFFPEDSTPSPHD